MTNPATLSDLERAQLADFSEAKAYEALVRCAAMRGDPGFQAVNLGAAVALRSTSVRSSVLFNRVLGLGLVEPATAEQLDEASALYAAEGLSWGIELSPAARPPELVDALRRRRMRPGLPTVMLIRSCADAPAVQTDLRIERVGPEWGPAGAAIAAEIFRVPAPVQALLEIAPTQPGYRQWIAFDGDVPVASCLSYVHDQVVWSGWSSTLPSHRGRRVHAAFLAACMRDAEADGCQWFTAETALGTPESPDPAYRNLLRMGFMPAYERRTYIGVPRQVAK